MWLGVFLTGVAFAQDAEPAADDEAQRQRFVGRVITIPSPIGNQVEQRTKRIVDRVIDDAKRSRDDAWPVFIFEFEPGASDLGAAYDFAKYLSGGALAGSTTVAYIPEPLTGHAVLPVLACDEIVMHPDASLGDAGIDEQAIDNADRSLYRQIAGRRRTVPEAVALGLLDRDLEVLVVETEVSREFVLSSELEELRAEKAIQSEEVLFRGGESHVLSAGEARQFGFASRLAEDSGEAAKAWGLSREALQEDPSLAGGWRAVRVPLEGPITAASAERVRQVIDGAIRDRDVNFICLWIDSPGGSPDDAMTLANYLADLDPRDRRTVAYIPREARADAAFVALACDQIVMHGDAVLGGPGAYELEDPDGVALIAETLRELAARKFRSPALAAAMVDRDLKVYRCRNRDDGLVEYFSEDELDELDNPDQWERGAQVTVDGSVLRVDGEEAVALGLATQVVDDFAGLKRIYGLESDPELVEPGWAHTLIDALRSPGVAWLLLVIGGAALYAEFQAPGIGIGAFLAAVCFLLYFWAMHLGGTAGWLEILLFFGGVLFVLIEIFVLPGFGIFGLGGGIMILSSLVLASQTFVVPRNEYQFEQLKDSMLTLVLAAAGVSVGVYIVRRYLPRTPLYGQFVQTPLSEDELDDLSRRESLADYERLLGTRGTTITQLTPAGKARFGGEIVDVICDGDVIPTGTEVEVIKARANRVVVRAVME